MQKLRIWQASSWQTQLAHSQLDLGIFAGLRAQHGMRMTPRALRPDETFIARGSPALPSPNFSPNQSLLSQAAVGSAPSPLSLSLVDAWDTSMTQHQSSPSTLPTLLLMGPSRSQSSSAVASPDRPQAAYSPSKHLRTPSQGSYAGLWDSLQDATDADVILADEQSVASDNGSPQFQCHHASCLQSPTRSSVTSSPFKQNGQHASSQPGSPVRSQSRHHDFSQSPTRGAVSGSTARTGHPSRTGQSSGQPDTSPPCIVTDSPLRPKPVARHASSAADHAEGGRDHSQRGLYTQHMAGRSADDNDLSLIQRSFVISEARNLAGSTSISPHEPASAFQRQPPQMRTPTSLARSPMVQSAVGGAPMPTNPAAVNLPHHVMQEDLPVGSPLSQASSGPLAGRPILPGSSGTASPSDLSSPESGTVHALDGHDSQGNWDSPVPHENEASSHPAKSDSMNRDKNSSLADDDAIEGTQEDGFDRDEFSIGAVHTSPEKRTPAQMDTVQWRSGISSFDAHHRGSSSEPPSPMGTPMNSLAAGLAGANSQRPHSSSPTKTSLLASNSKEPWTVYRTPNPGTGDAMAVSSSKFDASGEEFISQQQECACLNQNALKTARGDDTLSQMFTK